MSETDRLRQVARRQWRLAWEAECDLFAAKDRISVLEDALAACRAELLAERTARTGDETPLTVNVILAASPEAAH